MSGSAGAASPLETPPRRPLQPVAPGTAAVELERLAYRSARTRTPAPWRSRPSSGCSGRALLEADYEEHYLRQNTLLADLSEEELATLVTLLRKVRGATPTHLAGDSSG